MAPQEPQEAHSTQQKSRQKPQTASTPPQSDPQPITVHIPEQSAPAAVRFWEKVDYKYDGLCSMHYLSKLDFNAVDRSITHDVNTFIESPESASVSDPWRFSLPLLLEQFKATWHGLYSLTQSSHLLRPLRLSLPPDLSTSLGRTFAADHGNQAINSVWVGSIIKITTTYGLGRGSCTVFFRLLSIRLPRPFISQPPP